MGKYMKKSRVSDVPPQHAMVSGVRTRAKTLALQKQFQVELDASSLCYLELRNRRLHKLYPPYALPSRPPVHRQQLRRFRERSEGNVASLVENEGGSETEECVDAPGKASLRENDLECAEVMVRTAMESTPCGLIRNPVTTRTPGSTTRRGPGSSSQLLRDYPTMQEMEEFFALAEEQQHKLFLEKYNFDIVKDSPTPGRFEWVRV
ncbi:hypothetical protein SAY87_003655 [Trapa incisa]|uniref:Cyclin-dependent kinase inhibitor n=1 Tax=Trapa incisa TaxID=236973 RepID=A0AAN7QI86_9MYRT|nr:hypothetical protein SAY87_003655 [Trapa incisa]